MKTDRLCGRYLFLDPYVQMHTKILTLDIDQPIGAQSVFTKIQDAILKRLVQKPKSINSHINVA